MSRRSISEATYFILASLATGPKHGYGVMADVLDLSDGRVKLGAGTLYGTFERLLDEGQIRNDRQEIVDGRLRRYYALAEPGRDALRVEADRLASSARIGRVQLAAGNS
jgi:PadR family transcriptional regulator, regulatory protein PadR